MDQDATLGLASQDMTRTWANTHAWTVLDTAFCEGERFVAILRLWQNDLHRPRMLHYVGIASAGTQWDGALASHCAALESGFHRLSFEGGQVSLTLCLGEINATLAEQTFRADTIFAGAPADKWAAQLLARRCRRKTVMYLTEALPISEDSPATSPSDLQTAWLKAAGFVHAAAPVDTVTGHFVYNPPWDVKPQRTPRPQGDWAAERSAQVKEEELALRAGDTEQNAQPPNLRPAPSLLREARTPGRCAVIGAGLSGASVARALALRGWQVCVFDQEATPAAQASGLPVGLAVPHVSADDSPRSRLTRTGTRLLVQQAQQLLVQGEDWEPSGVLERKPGHAALWHAQAAWVKPAALVRALLVHPGISFYGLRSVSALHHQHGQWLLEDTAGQCSEAFDQVVLANALECRQLLQPLLGTTPFYERIRDLQAVHGTVSTGHYQEEIPDLPPAPVNGHGCFVPHFPGERGVHWLVGASFEVDTTRAADLWPQHTANMARLETLAPPYGRELAQCLDRAPVTLWSATRCVTHDRLPLVGLVQAGATHGLWLCIGMGSRGLSLSALCAELLAARLCGEPLPIEARLARSLDTLRHRKARRGIRRD